MNCWRRLNQSVFVEVKRTLSLRFGRQEKINGGSFRRENRYGALLAASFFFLILFPQDISAQPVPCDGASFLFTADSETGNSSMHRVRFDSGNGRPYFETIKANIGYRVAAAGYSTFDQYIYALVESTWEVLRIDDAGNAVNLGFPEGLEPDMTYKAGTVSPSGRRFLVIGRDANTGLDETLFSIAVGSSSRLSAGRVSISNDFQAKLEDLTYDPWRGVLYGYDRSSKKLAQVNWLSGAITNFRSQLMTGVEHLGGLFFDRNGQLYGYGAATGSGEEVTIYRIDKLTGLATKWETGPSGRFSDACGCPYTLRSFKRAIPSKVVPCSELLLRYEFINQAGSSYSYKDFRDTLPMGFTITRILEKPSLGIVMSGPGTNILHISEMDVLLDTTRILVRVAVDETMSPGVYSSQARLSDFPPAIGTGILSDDPLTPTPLDPTPVEVLEQGVLDLGLEATRRCRGDGMILSTSLANQQYRWSTGDTTQQMIITEPGTYRLTLTTGCASFEESIRVASIPPLPTVDLGPDRELRIGDPVSLQPLVEASSAVSYQWSAGPDSLLNCTDCNSLSVSPPANTTYYVTISDDSGCTATDSVAITVLPPESMFFPSAFSPDGDGINDIFYIQGILGSAIIRSFRVFDRWGNLLFERRNGDINDEKNGWDGRIREQAVPAGVYLYTAELEFPDGTSRTFSGDVLLLK